MSQITDYRRARYVNKKPHTCPYCEDSDGYVTHVDVPFHAGDFSIWQECECKECRNRWYDIYQLIDIEPKYDGLGLEGGSNA